MKKFTIISLIIAAVLFGIGVLLTIIGLFNDGNVVNMWENREFSIQSGTLKDEDFDNLYNEDKFTEVLSCREDEITGLAVDVVEGSLVIKQSDDDMCHIMTSDESKVESRMDNGIVRIKEDSDGPFKWIHIGILNKSYTKTIIYLPEKKLKSIDIMMEAGNVKLYGFEAEKCTINMQAGALYGVEAQTFNEFTAKIKAGTIEMDELYADKGKINCELGNFSMLDGALASNDIKCQMGNVDLLMLGEEADYQYDVNVAMGDVDIGDMSYSGQDIHKGSDNSKEIKIDCEMGQVTVDFEQ